MSASRLLWIGLILGSNIPFETSVAAQAPLDSLTARELLSEAVSAYEDAPLLQRDDSFRAKLQELSERLGVAWDSAAHPPIPSVEQEIERLVTEGRLEDAIALVKADTSIFAFRPGQTFLSSMIGRWTFEEILGVAGSLGRPDIAVQQALHASAGSPGWEDVHRSTRAYLDSAVVEPSVRDRIIEMLDRSLARHDFERAWRAAEARDGHETAAARLWILDIAYDLRRPIADSLFSLVHRDVWGMGESRLRTEELEELFDYCEWKQTRVCEGKDFGPPRPPSARYLLDVAVSESRFAAVDSLLAELPPLEAAGFVAQWLRRMYWTCVSPQYSGCGRTYDSISEVWLPRMTGVAVESKPEEAEQLNVHLSGLWGRRDLDRAREAIERTVTAAGRSDAMKGFATSALTWRPDVAFQVLRERGTSRGVDIRPYFVHFMARGDTTRADEVLSLDPSSYSRMTMRLDWAEALERVGRWGDARDYALSALDEWDPVQDRMLSSRGSFNRFYHFELWAELIAWARAREDPGRRAAALASIVSNHG